MTVGPSIAHRSRSGASDTLVDSRQRPAAHASAWRSRIGRQLATTTTSPASAIKPPATMPSRSRPTGINAGRPSCVCAAEHARRAPRFAPRPGPACYFVTTLNLLRSRTYTTAPKLMSPHFNFIKMQAAWHRGHPGRAERAGTAAPGTYWTLKCPTRRAPTMLQTAGRLLGHRGNNYSNCEPMLRGAPRRSETLPGRGPEREEEDSGSLTRAASGAAAVSPVRAASTWSAFIGVRRAAVVCMRRTSSAPPRPRQPPLHNPVPPPDAERMRGDARPRVVRRRHRIDIATQNETERGG
ncbi:hypothetical protein EVAR_5118_1 [Eumeta japonica]|uniref:Uncharacterized protein n=1 Tax=Eumeta variegata TaxID=151549 RepID=A0A4C1SV48_EUMVA|nr:hypothetical protein EVAR_5118_1 [Eumeta japonica]